MKKLILSTILFLTLFIASYFALSFLIPGLRIKLDAPPLEYFFASITHMIFFKALLSSLAAVLAAAIPWLLPCKST